MGAVYLLQISLVLNGKSVPIWIPIVIENVQHPARMLVSIILRVVPWIQINSRCGIL
jgi:hypothetical protein